ncbi:response regulator transcription factor [Xanthovirga aplysinae]|uniref:response regulator transcription factor n=1 Tax=Xanthovirga aplysinae TaxID=2529853 RepID=UPI0012BBBD7E|nr:response regulator transcription factor [Xanthovirga aplysinae]MTI32159.1 response regulator transcription factor [Xanthovirga aplysinae]
MKRVLIIEDDKNLADLVAIHLKDLDCAIETVHDGISGFNAAMEQAYDLIILDIMLPKLDGIAVSQKLRALENYTSILMLTAKNEEFDKVLGLESGADDYMTKPFSIREFIARVKAIFRRQEQNQRSKSPTPKKVLIFENLSIDLEKRKVELNNKRIDLTPKEFDLLGLLASHPGRSFNREEILRIIWGYEFNGYEHTVNSHINRLRSKIEKDLNNNKFILTSWGLGYRFNDEI